MGSESRGRTLNIVAHADDDLLFLSPDLVHAIRSGRAVRTVFATAGGIDAGADYWQEREAGAQSAYAQMCGVADSWSQSDAGIIGYPIPVFTLAAHPSVSLAFMRLPDGNLNGGGFPSTNHESLQKLWTGTLAVMTAIDGSARYSKEALTRTFTTLMASFQPDQINTHDYVGLYGDGDHSDHYSVGYFVQAARSAYAPPHAFAGYEGYNISSRPPNVAGADLTAKLSAFCAYVQHDDLVWRKPHILTKFCGVRFRGRLALLRSRARRWQASVAHLLAGQSPPAGIDRGPTAWLQRQYTVASGFDEGHRW